MIGMANRICGVELGDLGLRRRGRERLFHLGLLALRVFVGAGGLSCELFGCELDDVSLAMGVDLAGWVRTLRLKRALSRPDMVEGPLRQSDRS